MQFSSGTQYALTIGHPALTCHPNPLDELAKGLDMKQNELRQTFFDVVPMKNVVGIHSRAIAYQINVHRGPRLASAISVTALSRLTAANDRRDAANPLTRLVQALVRRLVRL